MVGLCSPQRPLNPFPSLHDSKSREIGWNRREAFEAVGEGWSRCSVTVWVEWETYRQSVPWQYVLQTGTQFHWCARGWELEHGDWRVILGWGLLLTSGRWPEGKKERNLKQRMPLERNQVAMEAGCYCWVMHSGWNHHYSPFLPSCWLWQLCNREGPARAALWVPVVPSNREGPVRETL